MRSTVLSLLGALQLVSCGGSTPPVTVVGTASDIQALSGTWYGDYSSPITGRSGSILFELRAAGDSAFGRVVMTPHGATGALAPWRDARMPQSTAPTELTIRFVRITNERITGSLTPYADPSSGEPLFTVFEGQAAGDTISGTFTTRSGPGPDHPTGQWRVVRSRR
jgi:hypothetical protein